MTLNSAERRTVLQAISIAIEKEYRTLQQHQKQAPTSDLRESTRERQRELKKFEELRARIIEADDRQRTAVPIKLI